MLEIKDIVNVVVNRETTTRTTADLQTIAILSVHQNFASNEVYREYGSTTQMLEDTWQLFRQHFSAAEVGIKQEFMDQYWEN